MRVHVDDRPRIESTSTSSTARCAATSELRSFHRSRPASAASLLGELAITMSGIFGTVRGVDDESVTLEVSPGVQVKLLKGAVARKLVYNEDEYEDGGDDQEAGEQS